LTERTFGHQQGEVAWLSEVFSSAQGEGLYVGCRQVFVRFAGCNLRCAYCDTPASRKPEPRWRAQETIRSQDFRLYENPASAAIVEEAIARLDDPPGWHHAVAITGGEPLLQADFLEHLLDWTKQRGLRGLLETNGTRPAELARLAPRLDIVSLDAKLDSATGEQGDWEAFVECARAARGTDLYVKVVVTAEASDQDVAQVCEALDRAGVNVPVVLQPVSPVRQGIRAPSGPRLLALQAIGLQRGRDVRIIPQCHRLLDLL